MLKQITAFADKYDMLPPGGMILVCVSGGADSMCLLAALLEISADCGFSVAATHYNHRLRGAESDRDERFVRDFCEKSGVMLTVGSGDVAALAEERRIGIEDAARRARYAFFAEAARETGAVRIATAHTADDNAETVIMNLTRGAGTAGLSGIPPVRGIIIRPMLTVTRTEVAAFLAERGVPYVEDSTNGSDIYTRNRVRHGVIPLLGGINPRFVESVTSMSGLLREDEEYLSVAADKFIKEHLAGGALDADALRKLPPAISGRVIRRLGGDALSRRHVDDVIRLCRERGGARRLSLPGITVFFEQGRVVFGAEAPHGFAPVYPKEGETAIIPEAKLKMSCKSTVCDDRINKSLTTFLFKTNEICGTIIVRPRFAGDRLKIAGRGGTKSLKKLFIEERVPASLRGLVPVVADNEGVLAVCGLGAGDRALARSGDTALEIKFEGTTDNG